MAIIYLEELSITPHKKRILQLRLGGQSPQDIADKFGLSVKTIEAHMQQIYDKYDVHNLLDLVIKMGWLRVSLSNPHPLETKETIGLTSSHVL